MSYGARVWDENGNLVMDTNTFTYQVIWQGVIDFSVTQSGGTVYTYSIPGFDPSTCVFMIIPIRSQDIQEAEATPVANTKSYPYVSVSPGQVIVQSYNPSTNLYNTNQTRVVVKGYAVRLR